MRYIIEINEEKYNELIDKKYPVDILIYKLEYQNMKYNDEIEYVYNSSSLIFNIRKIIYSSYNFKGYEFGINNKLLNKIESLKEEYPLDIEKYGLIYVSLYYKNEEKEKSYHLENNCILDYLIKEKDYLKTCNIYNEYLCKLSSVDHYNNWKISLEKDVLNPHLIESNINEDLLTSIYKKPINLLNKILNYKVYLLKENDQYIYVSDYYFNNNKEKEYLEGIDALKYIFSRFNLEKEIENEKDDEYRKELLIKIKEKNILEKYLFINEIIVPDIMVKRYSLKNIEQKRLDQLYFYVLRVLERKKRMLTIENVPYLIFVNEDRMLNKYLIEIIQNLRFNDLLVYNEFGKIFTEVEIKDLDFYSGL